MREKTTEALIAKADLLFERGILPTNDPNWLREYVRGFFKYMHESYKEFALLRTVAKTPGLQTDLRKKRIDFYQSEKYEDLIRLMVFAGTLTPITAGDWSTDRVEEVEEMRGFASNGVEKLEAFTVRQALERGYIQEGEKIIHFHLGPGNGVEMDQLRRKSQIMINGKPTSEYVQEVGVGFALHHNPTSILDGHIKASVGQDSRAFIEQVLKPALLRGLKNRWYQEVETADVRKYVPRDDTGYFDNNVMFELLANPRKWLTDDPEIVRSIEFEADLTEEMSVRSYEFLLTYLGYKKATRDRKIADFKTTKIERELKVLRSGKTSLGTLKNEARKLGADVPEPESRLRDFIKRFEGIDSANSKLDDIATLDDLFTAIDTTLEQVGHKEAILVEKAKSERIQRSKYCKQEFETEEIASYLDELQTASVGIENLAEGADSILKLKNLEVVLQDAIKAAESIREADMSVCRRLEIAISDTIDACAEVMSEKLKTFSLANIPFDREDVLQLRNTLRNIKLLRNQVLKNLQTDSVEGINQRAPRAFLKARFSGDLMAGVDNHEFYAAQDYQKRLRNPDEPAHQDWPDLNREAITFPYNFVPADFLSLEDVFPENAVGPSTGTRSSSHPGNSDFKEIMRQNLRIAAPGRIIDTDGFKHSFTRILRIPELQELLREDEFKGQFQMKIRLSAEGEPISEIIQKKHTKGETDFDFHELEDPESELRQVYAQGVYFEDPDAVMKRLDLKILDEVRRLILQATKDGADTQVMKEIEHDNIISVVKASMVEVGREVLGYDDSFEVDDDAIFYGLVSQMPKMDRSERKAVYGRIMERVIADIKVLTERAKAAVSEVLYQTPLLEKSETKVLCLARSGMEEDDFNRTNGVVASNKLYTNDFLRNPNFLAGDQDDLQHNLGRMRAKGIDSPILCIDFTDCITNELLRESHQRQNIGNYCRFNRIDFNDEHHLEMAVQSAERMIRDFVAKGGGILRIGGSWANTHEGPGKVFTDRIAPLIVELAMDESTPPLMVDGICFGHQAISHAIGQMYCDGKVSVRPGLLELGPSPVNIKERDHPFFKGVNARGFSCAFTHGNHVDDQRSDQLFELTQRFLNPFATSVLTGQHAFFDGLDGRYFGGQPHEEILGTEPVVVKRVMGEVIPMRLQEQFGPDTNTILQNNWNHAIANGGAYIEPEQWIQTRRLRILTDRWFQEAA